MNKTRSLWDRWMALLLHAYPKSFRVQFGSDLAAQYASPDKRRVRAAAGAAWELLRGGMGARLDDARRRHNDGPRRGRDGWLVDLKHAARGLKRSPMFAATIIATLALAASLNAAVFGIVDVTLLRPLPYPGEDQIVSIGSMWTGFVHSNVSVPEYVDYSRRARSFESVALYGNSSLNLGAAGSDPERIQAARATPSFFRVLGVQPMFGRTYTDDEDVKNAQVIVLSHRFWQRRFGSDPHVIGKALDFDSGPREIIGVMPEDFRLPLSETDVWVPMNVVPIDPGNRGSHNRMVIARLHDGVGLSAAREEMQSIALQLQREYPAHYPEGSGWGLSVVPLRERLVGDLRDPLRMLMAAVAFVLLIACANVANVLVARGTERRRELATRSALGAPRGRLVRQSMLEGLLAGAVGGLAGFLLAAWLLHSLQAWLPDGLPHPENLLTDLRVILFALGVTAFAGVLAALTALRATAVAPAGALRGERSSDDAPARRLRTMLAGAEVALAVLLLVASGFVLRSFILLLRTDPGLSLDSVATARVNLSAARYPDDPRQGGFFIRAYEALARQPGVVRAGAVSMLPLSGQTSDWVFGVEGWVSPSANVEPDEQGRVVIGEYFQVLDIPLVKGRFFDARDSRESPRVAIVSDLLARKYWRNGNALGGRVRLWGSRSDEPWATVVGIVSDLRHRTLSEDPVPMLYLPATQYAEPAMTLVAKLAPGHTRGPQVIADAVREVDPQQPIWAGRTMDEWLSRSLARPRFNLALLVVFSTVAIALAAIGVYGVTAFSVTRRTRELGIRVALGARPQSLMAMVLKESLTISVAGIAVGSIFGALAGRYLATLFYQLRVADPIIFLGVAVVVLAVAVAATYIPARRAMTVNPVQALRSE